MKTLSSVSPGTTAIPGRSEKQRLCKSLGANEVFYGRCENDEFKKTCEYKTT